MNKWSQYSLIFFFDYLLSGILFRTSGFHCDWRKWEIHLIGWEAGRLNMLYILASWHQHLWKKMVFSNNEGFAKLKSNNVRNMTIIWTLFYLLGVQFEGKKSDIWKILIKHFNCYHIMIYISHIIILHKVYPIGLNRQNFLIETI